MLRLPVIVLEETIRMLAECGNGQAECVVFWKGPVGVYEIGGWDHPAHHTSRYGYRVYDNWLTEYFLRLRLDGKVLRAQIHTHPAAAFHSKTDDDWPVISRPGFVSIVLPNFAKAVVDLSQAWVGLLGTDGRWTQVPVSSVIEVVQ